MAVTDALRRRGHEVLVISPGLYRSLPCPTYPEIRLALSGRGRAIPQEVAIDVNVRGLFARNERKR